MMLYIYAMLPKMHTRSVLTQMFLLRTSVDALKAIVSVTSNASRVTVLLSLCPCVTLLPCLLLQRAVGDKEVIPKSLSTINTACNG